MTFSTDRDLLVLEPGVFTDVPQAGQERLRVADASVAGSTLTSASADFAAAGVTSGGVVLLAGVPIEVVARVDAHTLTVSRLRALIDDAPIPPAPGTDLDLICRTFAPQAQLVHDWLIEALTHHLYEGLRDEPPVTDASVMSRALVAQLEALGTLERVYAGAVALSGDNGELWKKAAYYHTRFRAACRAATVRLDLDGDGFADTIRPLGVIALTRV